MKFSGIYGEPEAEENRWYLKLMKHSDGITRLLAVGENGNEKCRGCLLCFSESGRPYRLGSVNPDFGLHLDDDGRIIIGDE